MTDKSKFRSSSLNKRPSSRPSSIIKMWIYPEGGARAIKLKADVSLVEDLDDLANVLTEEINVLRNVDPQQLVFLDNKNRPVDLGTDIALIETTDKEPLVVRYPLSDIKIFVDFKHSRKSDSCIIPHSSGSLSLLKEKVMKKFKYLQEQDIYFFHEMTNADIRDTFNFNNLVTNTQLEDNECKLKLKVMIEGKRSYSEWELKEVLTTILGDKYDSITKMPVLDFQEFPAVSFSKKFSKDFTKELRRVFSTYRKETNTNEQVCREYISIFLRFAVHYAICNINDETWMTDEWDLKETRGNGPIDYIIFVGTIIVLICEAKCENMNKGIAQILVQLYSAMEEFVAKEIDLAVYGIVTTGTSWRFVRWSGLLDDPTIHLSQQFICNFEGDLQTEINILLLIVKILQGQCESVPK